MTGSYSYLMWLNSTYQLNQPGIWLNNKSKILIIAPMPVASSTETIVRGHKFEFFLVSKFIIILVHINYSAGHRPPLTLRALEPYFSHTIGTIRRCIQVPSRCFIWAWSLWYISIVISHMNFGEFRGANSLNLGLESHRSKHCPHGFLHPSCIFLCH